MSAYRINKNTHNLKDMYIKMTTTYGASGISGLICITISRLNKTELLILDDELKVVEEFFYNSSRFHYY